MSALKKIIQMLLMATAVIFILTGCSGGSPTAPGTQDQSPRMETSGPNNRILFGLWHVDIDPQTGEMDVFEFREASFHLNAVSLLEQAPPFSIGAEVLGLSVPMRFLAVRVRLTHPEINPVFRAFDVRGIVFSKSTDTSWTEPGLRLPKLGDNLYLRNPDGYTRWWNPSEFLPGAGGIRKYFNGKLGKNYTGSGEYNYNGTVNPYKYFLSGAPDVFEPTDPFNLDNDLDLVDFFSQANNYSASEDASIAPGGTATRIYQFSFSDTFLGSFGFNYAIDGSWAFPTGTPPYGYEDFPKNAHCPEPFLASIEVEKNSLYCVDEYCQGGEISFLVNIWDWQNYNDGSYFEYSSPEEGVHGGLRLTGRDGFLDGAEPTVELVASDENIKRLTYRLTYTDPPLSQAGVYNVMLIAEHGKTFPPVFSKVDDLFIATYFPDPELIIVPFFCPDFELPYDDPADLTTWGCWQFAEYQKTAGHYYEKVSPQPAIDDTNYYHWGLSTTKDSWSSQVHYSGGEQVQDLNGYVDNMRNVLISPKMIFPDSGAIKVTLTHTFSTEPFDDFCEIVYIKVPIDNPANYYPLIFYRFTGELPGNESGLSDGARTDVFYIDRLTSFVGSQVQVYTPAPGSAFRLAFFFVSNTGVSDPYLGWEIGHLTVEASEPWASTQLSTVYNEHFDETFPTQDMWQFVDANGNGEYWGLENFIYPSNDGTFLDAFGESDECYGPSIDEEAVLTLDLPASDEIILKMRHRFYLDLNSYAFLAVNDNDGDDPGEEYTVPYPSYYGGCQPYIFTRGTEFSDTFQDTHNIADGWGNFCWTAQNTGNFGTVDDLDDEISSYFDLTPYAGETVDLRFIFRSGPDCSCEAQDDCKTPIPFQWLSTYSTWRIEEVTIKAK